MFFSPDPLIIIHINDFVWKIFVGIVFTLFLYFARYHSSIFHYFVCVYFKDSIFCVTFSERTQDKQAMFKYLCTLCTIQDKYNIKIWQLFSINTINSLKKCLILYLNVILNLILVYFSPQESQILFFIITREKLKD